MQSRVDNSKYEYNLAKELHILLGTETRQLFGRMFVNAKKIKELFHST